MEEEKLKQLLTEMLGDERFVPMLSQKIGQIALDRKGLRATIRKVTADTLAAEIKRKLPNLASWDPAYGTKNPHMIAFFQKSLRAAVTQYRRKLHSPKKTPAKVTLKRVRQFPVIKERIPLWRQILMCFNDLMSAGEDQSPVDKENWSRYSGDPMSHFLDPEFRQELEEMRWA